LDREVVLRKKECHKGGGDFLSPVQKRDGEKTLEERLKSRKKNGGGEKGKEMILEGGRKEQDIYLVIQNIHRSRKSGTAKPEGACKGKEDTSEEKKTRIVSRRGHPVMYGPRSSHFIRITQQKNIRGER